jgi:hypothetical protein
MEYLLKGSSALTEIDPMIIAMNEKGIFETEVKFTCILRIQILGMMVGESFLHSLALAILEILVVKGRLKAIK